MAVQNGQFELLEVAEALRLARRLNGGDGQADQKADDRDHDHQHHESPHYFTHREFL